MKLWGKLNLFTIYRDQKKSNEEVKQGVKLIEENKGEDDSYSSSENDEDEVQQPMPECGICLE